MANGVSHSQSVKARGSARSLRRGAEICVAGMPEPREGRVWPDKRIRTAFENAVEAAGLKDFTFHGCRHHFASWFMMRGGQLEPSRLGTYALR